METLKIAVKFCGNCNPAIDVCALVEALRQRLPTLQIVPSDTSESDVLLLLGACTIGCTTRPAGNWRKTITVAGETVDHMPCGEPMLAETIAKKL